MVRSSSNHHVIENLNYEYAEISILTYDMAATATPTPLYVNVAKGPTAAVRARIGVHN